MCKTLGDLTIYLLLILFGSLGLGVGLLLLCFLWWLGEKVVEGIKEELEIRKYNDQDS
jgi:hypothetical protein